MASIFGKLFGRKGTTQGTTQRPAQPRHPGPDADGVSRVIPKEVWDGPHGDFLREIGVSPDDENNLLPTRERVQGKFDELVKEQEQFVAGINEQLSKDLEVAPWAMLPWALWQQQHADFLLVACELYPVNPHLTMLLPTGKMGAMTLNLPEHPRGVPDGLEEAANRVIGEVRQEFQTVHNKVAERLANGDTNAVHEHALAKRRAAADVVGIGHYFASKTFGDEAFNRHREVWGATLGWKVD